MVVVILYTFMGSRGYLLTPCIHRTLCTSVRHAVRKWPFVQVCGNAKLAHRDTEAW